VDEPVPVIRRKVTLVDVAATAGVSLPTVSKVLNGHGDVAPETRQRVQAALTAHEYIPRGGHHRSVPRSIEVMADHLSTPYAMEVLRGTTLAAEELGLDIVVSRFHRAAPETGWLNPGDWAKRLAVSQRTGAIILTGQLSPEHILGLGQEHLPVVVIDPLALTNSEVPSVGSTNWAGGKTATDHLISLGHTRIGAIGGREESIAASARMHGFRAACASAGIPVDESLVTFTGFDYDSGLAIADEWFSRGPTRRPTAIFAASDTQAMGVLEAARRHGLGVPCDLSVIGYDDTYIASWATPQLTCIRQPLEEMGRVAVRTLLTLADGGHLDARHVELATELVIRNSTAAPPADPSTTHQNNPK
jgi:LacI family transcriptional regulator